MDITDFTAELLAFGEPTHFEPAFARIRNDLFARLAGHGFRSIALETDRVAALDGGFSHGFGEVPANRQLLAWLREYNETAGEPLTFHGFDAPAETFSAPSPRSYLEHVRDYLGLDVDVAALTGDDERWSRSEAILDPAESPGATPEARELRVLADDLLTTLYARAPRLAGETAWVRAKVHATAGLGLLRYHAASARPGDRDTRIARLAGMRAVLMAQNLLDIRDIERPRGRTLVFAHNGHLGSGAGAIVASLLGDRYAFIAGSLGHSEALGLAEPAADTYEGVLQRDTGTWKLTADIPRGRKRTDTRPDRGYFGLDQELLDSADAVLHVA
ncbi:erythromycin esterase family protein [Amycolatopsis sp. NBC_01488]|uniref:erythromycin esterase family protein n=1 Tax=Amycolatopsis sp. NBC_01488 TaxID=2903563 RepID=UPI002E2DFDB2|nr:erythromycin esterase family protein [Amycolatopsis sp. NBC_01488]